MTDDAAGVFAGVLAGVLNVSDEETLGIVWGRGGREK